MFKYEREMKTGPENLNLGSIGKHFLDICKIPHGSGNEKALCDHIDSLAKKNNYESIRDDAGNILVIIPANSDKEGTILQTHMDMVNIPNDMTSVTPELVQINGKSWIRSKDEQTTLGADNGIMLAFQLSLIEDSKTKKHGDIALLFTTEEETGMAGAINLGQKIKDKLSNYKNFINLDNETDKELIMSSAGLGFSEISTKTEKVEVPKDSKIFKISVSGLPGGHSGTDIGKDIPNAIKLIANKLDTLKINRHSFNIVSIGGKNHKSNAIPTNCEVYIAVGADDTTIEELGIEMEQVNIENATMLRYGYTDDLICLLDFLPTDVIEKNEDGSPKLSTNLGVVETTQDGFRIVMATRSSSDALIEKTRNDIARIAKDYSFSVEQKPLTSGWEANTNSKLYKDFTEKYGFHQVKIHAGLECGTLSGYLPNTDFISIGPTIIGPHKVNERVSVDSIKDTADTIRSFLYD